MYGSGEFQTRARVLFSRTARTFRLPPLAARGKVTAIAHIAVARALLCYICSYSVSWPAKGAPGPVHSQYLVETRHTLQKDSLFGREALISKGDIRGAPVQEFATEQSAIASDASPSRKLARPRRKYSETIRDEFLGISSPAREAASVRASNAPEKSP